MVAMILIVTAHASAQARASVTLTCDIGVCNTTDTPWTLDKCEVDQSGNPIACNTDALTTLTTPVTVNWTVKATKMTTTGQTLSVNGFVSVTNTGTAAATIGNIVINVQQAQSGRGGQPNYVTVASA